MTTLVSTLFTTLTGGGAAAATAAPAAAGAAAGGGILAGSSGFTLLQGIGTAFGAIATIGQANAQSADLKAQAEEQEFKSRDEFIEGQERQAALKLELAKTVQRQSVAFASGGVKLSSSSVEEARRQAIKDSERELGVASNDALRATFARRRQGRNLRAEASNVRRAGTFQALIPVVRFGAEALRRG